MGSPHSHTNVNMCAQCVFTCLDARVPISDWCSMPKPQFTDAGTLTPGPDCGISIPSIAPGGGGKGGGGGGRGVGAAEVSADFFFLFLSPPALPRKGSSPWNTQCSHKQTHERSLNCLNTARACRQSPPAFGYSLMYTCAPQIPTHRHTEHVDDTHRATLGDATKLLR